MLPLLGKICVSLFDMLWKEVASDEGVQLFAEELKKDLMRRQILEQVSVLDLLVDADNLLDVVKLSFKRVANMVNLPLEVPAFQQNALILIEVLDGVLEAVVKDILTEL